MANVFITSSLHKTATVTTGKGPSTNYVGSVEGGGAKDDLLNRPTILYKNEIDDKGGGGYQKYPILRRHSLWTDLRLHGVHFLLQKGIVKIYFENSIVSVGFVSILGSNFAKDSASGLIF